MTTHEAQMERYSEPHTEPPNQRVPTTHDLQTAAAQGDEVAARMLERYSQLLVTTIPEEHLRDAVAESLAGTQLLPEPNKS